MGSLQPLPKADLLIVDDEPDSVEMLSMLLESKGYQVRTAANGRAALDAAHHHVPDLVLLDVDMPGMTGFEVCKSLHRDPELDSVPVIFVSGHSGEEEKERGFEAGGVDYVTKPLHPRELLARVRSQLDRSQQRHRLGKVTGRLEQRNAELERANQERERTSLLDALTQGPNRRAFDACLAQEWPRAARAGTPLSIVLGDIDYFKELNDGAGPQAGDEALIRVAQLMREGAHRPGDMAARYGSEQFAMVLPSTAVKGAMEVAMGIRRRLAAARIPNPGSPRGVLTISFGIASCRPEAGSAPDSLLRVADDALYRAKLEGRDRIVAEGRQIRTFDDVPEAPRVRDGFIAISPRMIQVKELALRAASSGAPLLIMGEPGVGKEELARFIHAQSERANLPFEKIICTPIADALESKLFGHERGVFTGAVQRKEGQSEMARVGTILLDEISDMDLSLQGKLLAVLEDTSIRRIGGKQPIPMHARVVVTTSRSLEAAVAEGEFLEELYRRLKVSCIEIPPLRERREDLPLLADLLLTASLQRQGSTATRLPQRLLDAFSRYDWPGNVRELKHVIERYAILPDIEMIISELAAESSVSVQAPVARAFDAAPEMTIDGDGKIAVKSIAAKAADDASKRVILEVLREERWNRRRAAARLDICYKTLLNMLDRWKLHADIEQQDAGGEQGGSVH